MVWVGEMLEAVEPASGRQRGTNHNGYDRRRDDHSCHPARPRTGNRSATRKCTRPGRGSRWYFRDEGTRGRGQQDEADSHGGSDARPTSPDATVLPELLHGEETKVWGDPRAYRGQSEVIQQCAPLALGGTVRSRNAIRYKNQVDEVERAKNRTKSPLVRSRTQVEHVFGVDEIEVLATSRRCAIEDW